MSASTLDRVVSIISRNTSSGSGGQVDASTVLAGGGAMTDSVAMLELILELEKEFQIELGIPIGRLAERGDHSAINRIERHRISIGQNNCSVSVTISGTGHYFLR